MKVPISINLCIHKLEKKDTYNLLQKIIALIVSFKQSLSNLIGIQERTKVVQTEYREVIPTHKPVIREEAVNYKNIRESELYSEN